MKCFYHLDLDGRCAASIVALKYPECSRSDFYEVDYCRPFPFEVIDNDELVYILDWSLNQIDGGWERLMSITSNIIWIDHHSSAIEGCRFKFDGIQSTLHAGCVLTHEWFFPDIPKSRHVELIGDYDAWHWKYGQESLYMINGLYLYDTHPMANIWMELYDHKVLDDILGEGYIITEYKKKNFQFVVENLGYRTKFEGYDALVCNSPFSGSKVFDSIEIKPDLNIVYKHDGEKFTVSVYSINKNINCGEIARKYGGGGHIGAAGFSCNELPFKRLGGINEPQN